MVERSGLLIASARRRLRSGSGEESLVTRVRRHDRRAFETVYERHASQLLSFCTYMLGSRADAEDAMQATFISAYRALVTDSRPVALRPWLFTIARNECLTIIRKRRNHSELNGEVALTGDPVKHAEVHEDLVGVFDSIRELPEQQRAALVLAEFNGMSHAEIGSVLGVRAHQVKAFVYQARTHLLSDKHARETDCREVREELASAHGASRPHAKLRRHLRSCDACRAYATGVDVQSRQLAALVPLLPALTLKFRAIEDALGFGGSDPATYANTASAASTTLEVAGGGVTALVAKVATGLVAVGASAGVGVSVLSAPEAAPTRPAAALSSHASHAVLASLDKGRGAPSGGSGAGAEPPVPGEGGEVPGRWSAGAVRGGGEAAGAGDGTQPVEGASGGEPPLVGEATGGHERSGAQTEGRQHVLEAPPTAVALVVRQRGAAQRREARTLQHEERLAERSEHKSSGGGEGGSHHHEKTGTPEGGSGGSSGGTEGEEKTEGRKPKGTHGLPGGKKHHPKEEGEEAPPKKERHKHRKHHHHERKHEDGGEGEGSVP